MRENENETLEKGLKIKLIMKLEDFDTEYFFNAIGDTVILFCIF